MQHAGRRTQDAVQTMDLWCFQFPLCACARGCQIPPLPRYPDTPILQGLPSIGSGFSMISTRLSTDTSVIATTKKASLNPSMFDCINSSL